MSSTTDAHTVEFDQPIISRGDTLPDREPWRIFDKAQAVARLATRPRLACGDRVHAMVMRPEAPKSAVNVSPLASVIDEP